MVRASLPDTLDVCVSFVLFHNSRDEILRAVEQALDNSLDVYVVVVDNSVPPLDLSFLPNERVVIVPTGKNLGYGRGHNIALAASVGRCRYNLVLNTDLTMGHEVIPGLVAFMDARPEVGLAMPQVRYPDGTIQRLCRLLPTPADLLGRRFFSRMSWARRLNERYEFHGWGYDSLAEFPFLSGCFMLLRRTALDEVGGGFDERYFLFAEDLDLSRRIHAVARTLYVPEFQIVHEYRTKARPSFRRMRYAMVSLSQYFTKWGWVRDSDRYRINQATLDQFGHDLH